MDSSTASFIELGIATRSTTAKKDFVNSWFRLLSKISSLDNSMFWISGDDEIGV